MEAAESLPTNPEAVLTQSEVEKLLSQVAAQEGEQTIYKANGKKDKRALAAVQTYNFRQPAFLSPTELRKLQLWHDEFVRDLAARLSVYLRLEVSLQISKLQTLTFQKFVETLPSPTYLTLFKVEPMRGVCILDLPTRLGLVLVDRLLGGPARPVNLQRDLSEIEVALLDQLTQIPLQEWCSHWRSTHELRPVVLGHESNGRFLQTAPFDTVMLTLAIEVRIGDCTEQIQFAFPSYTVEPLVARMSTSLDNQVLREVPPVAPTAHAWNTNLDDLEVTATAEWRGMEITLREFSRLKPGDVLELQQDVANNVQMRFGDSPSFVGTLGAVGNSRAVQITQIIKS